MKKYASVYVVAIVYFFASHLTGTTNKTTEPFHYEAHYSNITFSEAISTCTDYRGTLAEFPDDYNYSVLISSVGLPAYSQFWLNASSYLNCTCLSTFRQHWIIEGINCNRKVYYICRQPLAISGSLVNTDKSLTVLQTPAEEVSRSFTLLQMPVPELSLTSTPLLMPVSELSPSFTSFQMSVEEFSLTSTTLKKPVSELSPSSTPLQMQVEELSPTLTSIQSVSEFSPTSASSVHVQEGQSSNDSSFNLVFTMYPSFTLTPSFTMSPSFTLTPSFKDSSVRPLRPFSQLLEKELNTHTETANFNSTMISMTKFSCVQMCCSDVYKFCNNHTRENQRNISISELINELSLDKRSTCKHSRRLYSASDSRTSSKAMGVGAILIICSIITCIVAMDLPRIIGVFCNK